MSDDLEAALTRRAWTDPEFAEQLRTDPTKALAALGVSVPAGLRFDIRVQRRDTLYFTFPPARPECGPDDVEVVNQFDLWRSGESFVWLMPEAAKVDLLAMRRGYRPGGTDDA
ncbi:nitrile hydratase [Nocardia sp. CDC159]|uniref:Nitrile hydratase n=1 Tax=Nocardia pulmonis TaxID=2951408 RepID=A0A9X2E451_9NOCA|nr:MULTISPECIES: nitrile hydratase [Nocardia]MCM6773777.1 nitrile hydratase [Nocardia pulmonis]MCM6786664.1 nitrile hydratase [Nocardia sp. CDC159]